MFRTTPLLLLLACGNPAPDSSTPDAPEATWACGDAWTPTDPDLPLPSGWAPQGEEFLVVVLPDTQVYADSRPETFDSQLQWVARWAEAYNIVFVSHVGDIVQSANALDEWAVARAAYDWLEDDDIAHGFSIGAHDYSGRWDRPVNQDCGANFTNIDCEMKDFLDHFGPERYAGRSWYAGSSPSGHSSFQRVTAGGMDLIFLHMPQDPRRAEVDWAKSILDANPGTLAHLTTHRYLFDYRLTEDLPGPLSLLPSGRFNALTYLFGGQTLKFEDSLSAEDLFEEIVSTYPNIWGVHCGHVDAEFKQTSTNAAGLPVYEILVDYQNMADGGGGWMRLLKFNPDANTVDVVSFSTLSGEIRANGDGFDHSIEVLEDYKDQALSVLSQIGLDSEEIDALLTSVKTEGDPLREAYRAALYDAGDRDSCFQLEVDFSAYIDASR